MERSSTPPTARPASSTAGPRASRRPAPTSLSDTAASTAEAPAPLRGSPSQTAPSPALVTGWHELSDEVYHADPCPSPSLSSSIANLVIDKSLMHAWRAHPRSPRVRGERAGAARRPRQRGSQRALRWPGDRAHRGGGLSHRRRPRGARCRRGPEGGSRSLKRACRAQRHDRAGPAALRRSSWRGFPRRTERDLADRRMAAGAEPGIDTSLARLGC